MSASREVDKEDPFTRALRTPRGRAIALGGLVLMGYAAIRLKRWDDERTCAARIEEVRAALAAADPEAARWQLKIADDACRFTHAEERQELRRQYERMPYSLKAPGR